MVLATSTATIRVSPLAIAHDDVGLSVQEDGFLSISPGRLLANDTDGDRMVIAQVIEPLHGQVRFATNGSIRFTPDPDFAGTAGFRYVANTVVGGRAAAMVWIDVVAVNDPPRPGLDVGYVTQEEVPLVIDPAELMANDVDVEGDTITFSHVTSSDELSVEFDIDGNLVVSPAPYFFGTATFDYTVQDVQGAKSTGQAMVEVTPVNSRPDPVPDDLTIQEDEPVLIPVEQLLSNDVDYDMDALELVSVSPGLGGLVELFEANQSVLFTPARNWFGQAHFYYHVADGHGLTARSGVAVQVNPVNDAPTARDDSYSAQDVFFLDGVQDTALSISIADLLQNDFDVDDLGLTLTTVTDAEGGDVEIVGDHIVFTPAAGHWGEASFRYVVKDDGNLVDDAQVTMYFVPTEDAPPVAVDDYVTMIEDVAAIIAATALLGNDFNVDGDALVISGVSMPADFGSARINENGDVVISPALNRSGFAYFDYTVTDHVDGEDLGRVTIDILPVNDAPTVEPDFAATSLDVPLVLRISDLLANDRDVDLKPEEYSQLSFADVRSLSHGTASVYEDTFVVAEFPVGFSGTASLEYAIVDDHRAEGVGSVMIQVGDTPSAALHGSSERDLIYGSRFSEEIFASLGDDDVFARAGDDVIFGGDGADRIDGGDGIDAVDFRGSNIGVRADLAARLGQSGFAQGDEYYHVESLLGTTHDDTLAGDAEPNRLVGRSGDDELLGRDGTDELRGDEGDDTLAGGPAADWIDGGPGIDTADYRTSLGGVRISLDRGSAAGGDAEGDLLFDVENLSGSDFDDVLVGSAAANWLIGNRGRDILRGGGGPDVLIGGRDADQLHGGPGWDRVEYSLSESGISLDLRDPLAGGGDARGDVLSSIEMVVGSGHGDQIIGDDADNVFAGGRGADFLDGGVGFDTVSYADANQRVEVDLGTGLGTAGEAVGDVLHNFEQLIGSPFDDDLSGAATDETFDGGRGNDRLAGGFGSDIYLFGFDSGSDQISEQGAEEDWDVVQFGAGVQRRDVGLRRQGDDLWIELEHNDGLLIDRLRIVGHFLGRDSGVEQLVFADGTEWDRTTIDAFLRPGSLNAVDDVVRLAMEDVELVIPAEQLLRNDADDTTELRIAWVGNAANASVTVQEDGSVLFLGAPDFHGDAFFDYIVRDPVGRESTARVEVNLIAVNDAPVAANDGPFVGTEDTPLAIPIAELLRNDLDVDGDPLTIADNFGPLLGLDGTPLSPTLIGTNGEPMVVGDQVVFTPAVNHFGFAGFTYEVADGHGEASRAEVELSFVGVNDAPSTLPDRGFARLGRTESSRETSLTFNDLDPEGDSFSVTAVHSAVNGTVQLRKEFERIDGQLVPVTYIDFDGESLGPASYQYEVTDVWGASSTGTVQLTVIPLNDPPIARDDAGFETVEDQPLQIDPAVLLQNDRDPENEPLTISGFERFPFNGTVRFDEDGMIEFTPRPHYNGPAGFTYVVDDGQPFGTDTAFVSISVGLDNDGPVVADDVIDGVEDEPIIVIPGHAFRNDFDPEGDVIFFHRASVVGVVTDDFSQRTRIEQSQQQPIPSSVRVQMEPVRDDDGGQSVSIPSWLRFSTTAFGFERIVGEPFDAAAPTFDVTLTLGTGSSEPDLNIVARIDPMQFESEHFIAWQPRALRGGQITDPELVTASLWTGAPLPDWLEFDTERFEFRKTGMEPEAHEQPARVRVAYPAVVSERSETDEPANPIPGFAMEVWIDPFQELDPAINEWLQGEDYFAGPEGMGRSWLIPQDASVSARSAWGTPLPDWLEFDVETLTFSGLPPEKYVGVSPVRIDIGASQVAGTPSVALITEIYVDATYTLDTRTTGFAAFVQEDAVELVRPADFTGTMVVEYFARDATTVSVEPARIFVNVEARREPPLAAPDTFEVDEDGTLQFVLRELLANDRDGDGDRLRLVELSEPTEGTISTAPVPVSFELPNQTHLQRPLTHAVSLADGSPLPDWLEFDARTGQLAGVPPAGANEDLGRVCGDGGQRRATGARIDTARDSDGWHGQSDGHLQAAPQGFSGPVQFTYVVTDGSEGTDTGTVTIHVLPKNDPPVPNDDVVQTVEDTRLILASSQLLANDFDVDGNAIRITDVRDGEHGIVMTGGDRRRATRRVRSRAQL